MSEKRGQRGGGGGCCGGGEGEGGEGMERGATRVGVGFEWGRGGEWWLRSLPVRRGRQRQRQAAAQGAGCGRRRGRGGWGGGGVNGKMGDPPIRWGRARGPQPRADSGVEWKMAAAGARRARPPLRGGPRRVQPDYSEVLVVLSLGARDAETPCFSGLVTGGGGCSWALCVVWFHVAASDFTFTVECLPTHQSSSIIIIMVVRYLVWF